MRILFWNVRGLGNPGRRGQLKEVVQINKIEVVAIQETIRESFHMKELERFVGGRDFQWFTKPATGHSGGMLLGANTELFEVVEMDVGQFFISMVLKNKVGGKEWGVINVYGPVQYDRKEDFLREILEKCNSMMVPFLIGGDFNLVRAASEKSNAIINKSWAEKFNDCIAKAELRELHRAGGRFTWTNKQEVPVREVLDRVLVSFSWETVFPLTMARSLVRVGSDHNLIMVELEKTSVKTGMNFRFDPTWLTQEGFKEWVIKKWPDRKKAHILDHWACQGNLLRRFMRGWAKNRMSEWRKERDNLTTEIQKIEEEAEIGQIDPDRWKLRYELEEKLVKIYHDEEIYWQRRSGEKWVNEGDANTTFFHGVANGRKRKTTIVTLDNDGVEISDPQDIKKHIYDFYKSLFGTEQAPKIFLSQEIWSNRGRLEEGDNEQLPKPFSMEEIEEALKGMKTNISPGPDGLPVSFYKQFWPQLKDQIKEMLDLLFEDKLDMWRLNYGVITLIPKVVDANTIKQYRPICLLNVCFKLLTKILTSRLTLFASKIVNASQTTFIPGRYILDGSVILHEVLHELKSKNQSGIILKLDFEKAYDKVQWDFLFDVLQRKGFGEKWIGWIKQATMNGRVAININGVGEEFFKTHKGLRQGDPLSPLLFNLVADALAEMLELAKEGGHIQGLVPHLVQGGLTHLQYADDTILFMELSDSNILIVKFLLYCYEAMSGMKINYQKSEVIVVGAEEGESKRVADLFNCQVGSLPIKYLGLPVSDKKLTATDLRSPVNKIEKRLATGNVTTCLMEGDLSLLIHV